MANPEVRLSKLDEGKIIKDEKDVSVPLLLSGRKESYVNGKNLFNDISVDGNGRRNRVSFTEFGGENLTRPRSRSRFKSFMNASLSISMLAKPCNDRETPTLLTGWNVCNLIQGTGILGIPYAIQQGGWAGVFMVFFVAILCAHTGVILIDCLYETSKKTNVKHRVRASYAEIGEKCYGKTGYILVTVFQTIELLGAVSMNLLITGTSCADLLEHWTHLGIPEWSAINAIIILPFLFVTRMSIVSWFSLVSVVSLMASLIVLVSYSFMHTNSWMLEKIPPFNYETFPVGFGILVFSYASHVVFPSIEASMKVPESYNMMIKGAFSVASTTKAIFGLCLVLTFGKATKQVITVNLQDDIYFSIASTTLVITNVLLAIPLMMFVVTVQIDEIFLPHLHRINKESKYHWLWLVISRPATLGFTILLAVIVPHFGVLMGFLGSFTGTGLCFLFPCIFHLKLRWGTMTVWEKIYEIFIIVFGVIAGGLGITYSAKALVLSYA